MLTLNDGRSELWQWDTGRTLTVDADCSQVHFSNKVFGRSIDVDVVDGVAIIPDVLLQTDKDLNVWAFVGTAENGYTKISKTFKVNRRNKPADYVFTPPDQTTLGELVERLGKIEESQDPDAIKNAVDDYLANNPIMVKETDPTVPEWAKYPTKPSYTAAEVGAQPAGNYLTEIEIKPVIEATNSAQALAKQADKKVDTLREVVSKFHSNIVEEAKGDIITLDDASDMELAGLTLYGKTTQNGTPTPDSPVELESVGDDGSVAVTVCGKNLFRTPPSGQSKGINFQVREDGSVHMSGTPSGTYALIQQSFEIDETGILPNKTYTLCGYGLTDNTEVAINAMQGTTVSLASYNARNGQSITFSVPEETTHIRFAVQTINKLDAVDTVVYPMLNVGNTASEFEPYKERQTLTAQTPNGLPGIPVSSGGNYTDENGQQWVCDEIDFARGKYVQRVKQIDFDSLTWTYDESCNFWVSGRVSDTILNSALLCESVPYQRITISDSKLGTSCNAPYNIWVRNGSTVNTPNGKAMYQIATPIETDLTAEEIAQYSALHTNYPNTTVYNDEGAEIAVKYVADTKLYIDKKFAELSVALLNQ